MLVPVITFSQQATCYSDQSDSYWKISVSLYGSKRLSNCHTNAYYNCHGFVRSYFENGCTSPSWTSGQIAAPYTCPNQQGNRTVADYQSSGKYVQVCSETNANIAFYKFKDDNHSAVKEVTGGGAITKYLSKYGLDGPLVAHNLLETWYHLTGKDNTPPTPVQFWAYVGSISGNSNINGLNSVAFSANSVPTVNYSWSIVDGHSNIYISSNANQSTVILTPTHSGTAILQLSISSACGLIKTQQITLYIQTNICLEGNYHVSGGINQNLNTANNTLAGNVSATVTCPNANSFTWQKTSGSINSFYTIGANVQFTMFSGGSISFLITAKNGTNTLATKNVAFYNYGSFRVSPNPATTFFTIDINEDILFKIVLQDFNLQVRKEINNYRGKSTIDVSTLREGEYAIHIYHDGELINKQLLMISK